jgi:hypothetical protein
MQKLHSSIIENKNQIEMKKIQLNVSNLEGTEILSRDQLKSIFGGSGSSSSEISGSSSCTCSPACSSDQHCATDYDRGGCTCKANLA